MLICSGTVHEAHKPLYNSHAFSNSVAAQWFLDEFQQSISQIWKFHPCFPCLLLSTCKHERGLITPSENWKAWRHLDISSPIFAKQFVRCVQCNPLQSISTHVQSMEHCSVISLSMITRGKVIPRQIFIVWQNLLIQCCDNGLRTDSRKQIWGYLIIDVSEESSFVVVISKEVAQFLGIKALSVILWVTLLPWAWRVWDFKLPSLYIPNNVNSFCWFQWIFNIWND